MKYQDELYEGEHEKIVPEELFEKVQEQLATNRRDNQKRKPKRFGGILNGILRCKSCGSGMSHSYTMKDGVRRYRYYICNSASKNGWKSCSHPSLPAAEIEKFILDEILTIGLDDKLIEEIVQKTRQSIHHKTRAHKKQLKLLRKQLAAQEEQLQTMMAVPVPDPEATNGMREQITISLRDIDNARKRLETMESANFSASEVRDACRRFEPLWDTLSNKEQWRMLKTLLESVEFDAASESVNINFAPDGVRRLTGAATQPPDPMDQVQNESPQEINA